MFIGLMEAHLSDFFVLYPAASSIDNIFILYEYKYTYIECIIMDGYSHY